MYFDCDKSLSCCCYYLSWREKVIILSIYNTLAIRSSMLQKIRIIKPKRKKIKQKYEWKWSKYWLQFFVENELKSSFCLWTEKLFYAFVDYLNQGTVLQTSSLLPQNAYALHTNECDGIQKMKQGITDSDDRFRCPFQIKCWIFEHDVCRIGPHNVIALYWTELYF